jgi:hypothetical protein
LVTHDSGLSSGKLEDFTIACARADFVEVKVQVLERLFRTDDLAKTTLVDAFLPFVFNCQRAAGSRAMLRLLAARRDPRSRKTRVELIGFEPTTSSLQSWRSTN